MKFRWYAPSPQKVVNIEEETWWFFFKRPVMKEATVYHKPQLQYLDDYTGLWLEVPTVTKP